MYNFICFYFDVFQSLHIQASTYSPPCSVRILLTSDIVDLIIHILNSVSCYLASNVFLNFVHIPLHFCAANLMESGKAQYHKYRINVLVNSLNVENYSFSIQQLFLSPRSWQHWLVYYLHSFVSSGMLYNINYWIHSLITGLFYLAIPISHLTCS